MIFHSKHQQKRILIDVSTEWEKKLELVANKLKIEKPRCLRYMIGEKTFEIGDSNFESP